MKKVFKTGWVYENTFFAEDVTGNGTQACVSRQAGAAVGEMGLGEALGGES